MKRLIAPGSISVVESVEPITGDGIETGRDPLLDPTFGGDERVRAQTLDCRDRRRDGHGFTAARQSSAGQGRRLSVPARLRREANRGKPWHTVPVRGTFCIRRYGAAPPCAGGGFGVERHRPRASRQRCQAGRLERQIRCGDQFAGSKGPAWISQRAQLQGRRCGSPVGDAGRYESGHRLPEYNGAAAPLRQSVGQ